MVQWWSKDTCTWYVTEVSTVRGVGERTIYGHIVAPLTGSIFPARLTIPCQAPELAPPHSNDDGWACLLYSLSLRRPMEGLRWFGSAKKVPQTCSTSSFTVR